MSNTNSEIKQRVKSVPSSSHSKRPSTQESQHILLLSNTKVARRKAEYDKRLMETRIRLLKDEERKVKLL